MTTPNTDTSEDVMKELDKVIEAIRNRKTSYRPHWASSVWTLDELLEVATRKRLPAAVREAALSKIALLPDFENPYNGMYQVCKKWVQTRDIGLAELIKVKKWVLSPNSDYYALMLLLTEQITACMTHPTRDHLMQLMQIIADRKRNGKLADAAMEYLHGLEGDNLATLVDLWQDSRSPFLLEILNERNYFPPDSPKLQVWMTIFLPKWETELLGSDARIVEPLLELYDHSERFVAERARELLPRLENNLAQAEVCWQVILNEKPFAQSVALQQGWLPKDLTRKVLFYFVTEQWDKYDELDFDGRHLRLYYQTAAPDFRRRLAAKIRASGRTEYLKILTGGETRTRATEMDAAEAEIVVKILADNARWQELWELVPLLPLHQSARAILQIGTSSWQPDNVENQALLRQLYAFATAGILTPHQAFKVLPSATRRSYTRIMLSECKTAPEKLNDMAFSPVEPFLALAVSGGRLVLWNIQTAKIDRVIVNPSKRAVGTIAYTNDGTLCWGERSNTHDYNCAIYCLSDGEIYKLAEMGSAIKAMVAVGESGVVVSGQDGWLRLWDTVTRQHIASTFLNFGYADSADALCVSPDSSRLVVFCRRAAIFSLPDLELLDDSHYGWGVVQQATFAPDGRAILSSQQAQSLGVTELENGRLNPKRYFLSNIGQQGGRYVPGVVSVRDSNLVVVANEMNVLDFVDWESRQAIGRYEVLMPQKVFTDLHGNPIIPKEDCLRSIKLSSDGAFLAAADLKGCITLFDLRPMALWQIFRQPFAKLGVEHLAQIKRYREQLAIAPNLELDNSLAFTESALLGLRLRYAIELDEDEIISLKAGEFDIEVAE
jgi:WD40 repeat protein